MTIILEYIQILCDFCQGNHLSEECQVGNPFKKKADWEVALAQFANTTNQFSFQATSFWQVTSYMEETKTNAQNLTTLLQNQSAQLRNVETQLSQIANMLSNHQQESLPSNTEVNPSEQCQVITLQSRKVMELPTSIEKEKIENQVQVEVLPKPQSLPPQQSTESSPFPQNVKQDILDQQENVYEDPLETCLVQTNSDRIEKEEIKECEKFMEAIPSHSRQKALRFEELEKFTKKLEPSIEEPLILELKPLTFHLKYPYGVSFLLVINFSSLTGVKEEKLLGILREWKCAFYWIMEDIKGSSPVFCMHHIRVKSDKAGEKFKVIG